MNQKEIELKVLIDKVVMDTELIQRSFASMVLENDDHDCHLVGGGGESGCDNPNHHENN